MISILKRNKWLLIKSIIVISIAIPVGILVYESIFLGKQTVVFLEDYPTIVSIFILVYYLLLLTLVALRIIAQLKSVLKLKRENTKSELLRLQSQVNPHFFFNMLNNLYGLVDKDSEKAKKLILKLSDLMRYSIYEGEKASVTLEEEIDYLKNYIELHQMRYHKKIDIQFHTNLVDDTIQIRPLLFIILVENAFKHGVENLRNGAYVHITLNSSQKEINFVIENNFDPNQITKEKGIGIKNLKRRLELGYPKKHKLAIERQNAIYKAQLLLKQ